MLEDLLREKRGTILKRWFDCVMETYPPDGRKFLQNKSNQFANPVGSTIRGEIETVYDELLKARNAENLSCFIENLIRIRAVQDFAPSKALGFILHLKEIVFEELGDEIKRDEVAGEFLEFQSRIDELALGAFDLYMECREGISEIRVKEVQRRSRFLFERLNKSHKIIEVEKDMEGGPNDV